MRHVHCAIFSPKLFHRSKSTRSESLYKHNKVSREKKRELYKTRLKKLTRFAEMCPNMNSSKVVHIIHDSEGEGNMMKFFLRNVLQSH